MLAPTYRPGPLPAEYFQWYAKCLVYHILLFSKLIEVFLKKGLQFRKRCGIITKPSDETANRIVGVDYNEGPPVPIPNTEVKLVCAENTRLATARDDRLAPTLRRITEMWFFFYFSKAISSLCQRDFFIYACF